MSTTAHFLKLGKYNSLKTFTILWVLCLIGKMSVFPYIISLQNIEISQQDYFKTLFFGGIIYAAIIWLGLKFADKIALQARIDQCLSNIKFQWLFNVIAVGVITGLAIFLLDKTVFKLTSDLAAAVPRIPSSKWQWQGLLASLYGGINEEVMLRLFLMSFMAWGLIKICKKSSKNSLMIASIILSALLFGIAHLPAAAKLWPLTPFVVSRVLILNGLAGVVFGFLYWRQSLLAAMVAHFSADIVLHVIGI